MAEPITWRTIMGAQPAEASRPLVYAQQALNDGFSQLNKVLENRQAVDASNWEATKQNNTQAFLDKLAQFRTPEEMAAAQASGELDALRAGFGAQIDRAQTRNAQENRLDVLRSQARSALAYNNEMTDAQQLPIVERIKALSAQGKTQEAQALMEANPALRHLGDLTLGMVTGERATTEFGQKTEKHKDDLLTSAVSRRVQQMNANTSRMNAESNRDYQRAQITNLQDQLKVGDIVKAQEAQDKQFQGWLATTPYSQGAYDPTDPKAMDTLLKGMKAMGLEQKQVDDVLYNLNKYYKDGVPVGKRPDGTLEKVPLGIATILQEIAGAGDGSSWLWNMSRKGDNTANAIAKRFGLSTDTIGSGVELSDTAPREKDLVDQMRAAWLQMQQRSFRSGAALDPNAAATLNARLAQAMTPPQSAEAVLRNQVKAHQGVPETGFIATGAQGVKKKVTR